MEVILIRHTSVDVPAGVCYGQSDVPLRDSFETEAAQVALLLNSQKPFDAVFTSPLTRCLRLATRCGYSEAVRDSRLLEMNFGQWELKRFDEIIDPRLKEWYTDYLEVPTTGGESFRMQYRRVAAFFNELKGCPYRRVLIFTHGGVLECAKIFAGQVTEEEAFRSLTPYGGMIRIEI